MKRFPYTCILALIFLFSFSKTNAQSSIIGNPIKIGNIEVAQYDFRKIPWVDANNSCMSLGDGWRLPTIDELKILYQNRERIGNFKWDSYWSSTKGNVVIAWRLNFGDGMVYDRDNTDNTACVRAVRNSENHQNIQQEKEFNNLIKPTITCTINPSNIDPSGIKYVGGCINGTAEGIGIVTLANGTSIKGLFKNNKLQEGIVESRFTNGYITFGPYINRTYTGIYEQINIQNYRTQFFNLVNNQSVGTDGDYFNIPEPLIYEQSIFPIFQEFKLEKKYPIWYHFKTSYKIPNTDLELFKILPKLNQNGYSNECLTLYDVSNNKIIRQYGNYNNPLEFITFAADYKSFYVYQTNLKDKKIYNVEISTGLIKVAVSEQVQYVLNKIKYGNDFYNGSVIIKSNNKELWKSTELLAYSKEGKELSKLTIHNGNYWAAYAINENINQIALREDSKDSTFLSLYSLDSLKFIKRVISSSSFDHDALGFSPSGKYMYFNGTIFKGDSIYYGVHGNIISFNTEENIILCGAYSTPSDIHQSSAIIAFDLENKKILWRKKLEGLVNRTYKTENDIAIITTEAGGVGKMKPNIYKINLNYPEKSETFFSLNQKVQDELQAQSLRFKKEKEAQSQNVSNGTEGNNTTNNITESSDCSDIIKAYELAVRRNITALRKIRNNAFVSKDEFINLDNDIRKWQEIVMKKCAYDPKYANRVINIMEQLELGYNSTFPSIKENSVSNTNNNTKSSSNSSSSSSNSKQSSNSTRNSEANNQPTKTEKKSVDLSYEVLSQIVTCKSCSSPVTVKINVPRSDEFKKSFNQIGGLTSSMCNKCHKTSSFTYEMKAGKFTKIN